MAENQATTVATIVRAFDGSLADAKMLLAVERATFDESPYSASQVQAMLTEGPQRAWLAIDGHEVAGFVIAFTTHSLSGLCWELDLLAVHPHWRGQGLATRLIRAAAAGSPHGIGRARAVVATDNGASARAFTRAGFQPLPEVCTLLIYRPQDAELRPQPSPAVSVHQAAGATEAARWLQEFRKTEPATPQGQPQGGAQPEFGAAGERQPLLLLAERDGHPGGYAELLEVQTLLYRGAWIESLAAATRADRMALVEWTMQRGIAAGWDEIGAMVPEQDWLLRNALVAQGFRSLGDFRWLVADLPLPDPTLPFPAGGLERKRTGPGHV